jgi:hypothetical protein
MRRVAVTTAVILLPLMVTFAIASFLAIPSVWW